MTINPKYISVLKLIKKLSFLLIILFFLQPRITFSAEGPNTQGKGEMFSTTGIYRLAENNGIASGMCRALDFMNFVAIPVSAMMFVILGYNGLKGNLNYSSIVTFALAIGAMRGAGTILEIYLPGRGLKYGCKCAKYVITSEIDQNTGKVIKRWQYNGIHEDCIQRDTP
jgi:hypothetical protein